MTEPKDPINESTRRNLEDSLRRAGRTAKNKSKVIRIIKAASEKAGQQRQNLNQTLDDLELMFRLLRAWAGGRYTIAPWKSIVAVLAAVIYFLNPLDILPDLMPGLGYLDDTFIIGFVFASVKADLQRFMVWERSASAPVPQTPEKPPSSEAAGKGTPESS